MCDAFTAAAARGAACVVFARDPALRAIADARGWRQLGLVDGVLRPLAEMAPMIEDDSDSNVVPFQRAAGA